MSEIEIRGWLIKQEDFRRRLTGIHEAAVDVDIRAEWMGIDRSSWRS